MTEVLIVGLLSASAGILGGAVSVGVNAYFQERWHRREIESRDRQQHRLLGVEVGKAMYEHNLAIMKQQAATMRITPSLYPIAPYLVYGIRLMDIVSDPALSPEKIREKTDALAASIARELPHD
jgi:hypothetical protein